MEGMSTQEMINGQDLSTANVDDLLAAMKAEEAAAAPAEEFSWRVSAPNGAPALSLAVMAAEKPENYVFIAPDTIGAEFTKAESDFIIHFSFLYLVCVAARAKINAFNSI